VVGDGWWSVLVFGVWCLVVGDDGVGVFFRCWVLTLALMMVLVMLVYVVLLVDVGVWCSMPSFGRWNRMQGTDSDLIDAESVASQPARP
jgi:hypothetical protein